MRAAPRWAALVAGLAVLVALPAVIAARPLHARPASAQQLLARVRSSVGTSYSGLVETNGSLELPDIPSTGALAGLLSGTTRLRAWWIDDQHWRVDQLAANGEADTITRGALVTQWDSTRDEVTRTFGRPPLRVPEAGDLLPPALAERLVPDDLQARATRLPAVRIAGRTALGLRLTPTSSDTTVGHVDIDVDQDSGLPMRVEVTARGHSSPSVGSNFLELSLQRPGSDQLDFTAPAHTTARRSAAPDLVADADRNAPFQLPGSLAGLPRSQRVSSLDPNGGAATYGRGYTLLALLPVRPSTSTQIFKALQPPAGVDVDIGRPGADAVGEQIPLVNVLVLQAGDRSYVITGTVGQSVLVRAAQQLVDSAPPFQARFRQRGG